MSLENLVSVTFWGTEFFKSIDNEEVMYGERIQASLRWNTLVNPDELQSVSTLASWTNSLMIGSFVAVPVLIVLQRSLLSIWIMMVSMQLIAHMPLINTMTPSNVILFLRQILGVLRFFFGDNNQDVDSAKTSFNGTFENTGYLDTHLSSNLSGFLSVSLPLLVTLASLLIIYDLVATKKYGKQPPEKVKWILVNFVTFTIFFFAYCLLEVFLCAMVEIRAQGSFLGWFAMLSMTVPFVYIGTAFWKFDQKYSAPESDAHFDPIKLDQSSAL